MKDNPLIRLASLGQSVWLDFLSRRIVRSDALRRLIREDGVRGITSNPAIFEKAIAGSLDYDEDIRTLAISGKDLEQIYLAVVLDDIRRAADEFLPIYERTGGQDGFVSLEISPHLALDTDGTLAEARWLWVTLDRPNLLLKVPGTHEALPAIGQLVQEGINVNVTLLFSVARYRQIADAYLAGLEARVEQGLPLTKVASVASFFVSRVDARVDAMLEKVARGEGNRAELARSIRGEAAVANAKVAYHAYREIFGGERFRKLAARGAQTQRLLWASTGTKDPKDSAVKYVEALIGPDTINTMPLETLDAYRDHGNPAHRLEDGLDRARDVLRQLGELDIHLDEVSRHLEMEGIQKFIEPFDRLLATLEAERRAALEEAADPRTAELDDEGALHAIPLVSVLEEHRG